MVKLYLFLTLAILSSGVLGLSLTTLLQTGEKGDVENRYGWNRLPRLYRSDCGRLSGQLPHRCLDQIIIFPGQQTVPTIATTVPTPNVNGATEQSVPDQDCIRNCPVTPEYNPVCGSNGVTYDNPGRLHCAHNCGVNVNLVKTSRCPAQQ